MKKRVTIKDVAKEAGVSIAMVSLVVNSKLDGQGNPVCSVRKETARKIFDAVKKTGYIPNRAASAIRSGRSYTIAVITSDISSNFFSELCRHIENIAYDQGYNVLFASSDENPVKFNQILNSMLKLNVDGMIILPPPHGENAIENLSYMDIPVVLLERDLPGLENFGRVQLDNAAADRMAVEELYHSGYRNIELIVHDMDISTIRSRVAGYREMMTGLGLKDRIKIHYINRMEDLDSMTALLKNIMEHGCEAVYLASNSISILTLQAINRLQIKVPEELAVVGFDNSAVYNMATPYTTHVQEPVRELGEESFNMLMDMIEDRTSAKTVRLLPSLVRGGSSAPKGASGQ